MLPGKVSHCAKVYVVADMEENSDEVIRVEQ
jgi:hypothetical protein